MFDCSEGYRLWGSCWCSCALLTIVPIFDDNLLSNVHEIHLSYLFVSYHSRSAQRIFVKSSNAFFSRRRIRF